MTEGTTRGLLLYSTEKHISRSWARKREHAKDFDLSRSYDYEASRRVEGEGGSSSEMPATPRDWVTS